MSALRVALCIMAATTACAQTGDIFQRLRSALAESGNGDLATAELEKKDFAAVERILAEVKVPSPAQSAELISVQGVVAFLSGNMSAAVIDFQKASALSPLNDGDTFTLAMALVNLGEDAQARGLLTDLARKYPERSIYVYWLGRLDYDQRLYDIAVERLRKAAQLDPTSARAWDSLGLAFDMQGRMDQALAAFQRAVNLNRQQAHPSPWPPHNLGFLLLRMDQPKDAEMALRESLRYDSKLAQTHYHLGRTLEKEDRFSEAVEEYILAVSSDTASPDACYSLAMLYRKMHRDAEADAMFAEYKKRKQLVPAPDLTLRQDPTK